MEQLKSPTEADKQYFMEMRRRMLDANPGLPFEMAPGMRKSKKKPKKPKKKSRSKSRSNSKSKSRSRSRSRSKSNSKSKSKKPNTKREFMVDLFRRAKKELPFMRNRKDRLEYIDKLNTIPNKDLKKMTRPIQVMEYMPDVVPSQHLGYSAADLGQTLVRQQAFNPKKTVYESSRI